MEVRIPNSEFTIPHFGSLYGARARSVGPEGEGRPPVGSSVTDTPVTGRGTRGGSWTTIMTRPAWSGTNRPALTGSAAVNNHA